MTGALVVLMIVTWSYKPRDTIIQRFDPRARIIFLGCAIFAIIQIWDVRAMLAWLALAVLALRLSRIRWQEMKRFWFVVLPLITLFTTVTALTGRDLTQAIGGSGEHFLWTVPVGFPGGAVWHVGLSVERLVFAAAQFARMLSLAILGLLVPFTINPALYGVAFRRLGLNDKFAYATDLAFRLVPTVANDFQTTLDAQKARGYELDRAGANLFRQVRNLAPLVVPVTIGTILGGEEIIDAMDLRAFGATPRRTWVMALEYDRRDLLLIAGGVLALLATTIANILGYGEFWLPPALLRLLAF
ncbi:MAG: energy-coupling factor transporter transmembrane protein EcfT [Ardenticatenaceae bacterium]|nr:energy-coupling factor transporter transmembrane protein EcfT [Ardenticatenaceae bacterium]